ncbi:hypothetical protein OIU78_015289 [Salix suchowensis]|nr:hypothetical protein OIU78_015289 [Salix suchowensis]
MQSCADKSFEGKRDKGRDFNEDRDLSKVGCTVSCDVVVLFLREAAISGVKAKVHIRDLDYSWVWIHVILLSQSCGPHEGNKSPQPLYRVVVQYFKM